MPTVAIIRIFMVCSTAEAIKGWLTTIFTACTGVFYTFWAAETAVVSNRMLECIAT